MRSNPSRSAVPGAISASVARSGSPTGGPVLVTCAPLDDGVPTTLARPWMAPAVLLASRSIGTGTPTFYGPS
jgi:hypothetical protein